MNGVLTKRGYRDTHTGRMPCENEGRDQGDGAEAEERQRLPGNHQTRKEAWPRFSFTPVAALTRNNILIYDF